MPNNTNGRPSVRVLLVDDHSDTLEMLGQLMRMLGCEARACVDSTHCVEIAQEFQPHLILIDLGMPRMDGYAVAKALGELKLPATMLVALTGYTDLEHREKCAEAGFDQFLLKPASFEQLCDVIDETSRRFALPVKTDGRPRQTKRRGTQEPK